MAVTTGRWALVDTTTAENRCVAIAVTRATSAFLTIDLFRRIAGLATGLYLMGAGLRIVALPPDDAVQDIDTRLEAIPKTPKPRLNVLQHLIPIVVYFSRRCRG